MSNIFADTSGWGNLIDASQPFHIQAAAIYRDCRLQGRKVITTNYVITELVALMHSPLKLPRSVAIGFVESLKTSPFIEIVHVDVRTDKKAWNLLKNRSDKEWSLVDCSSFVVMQERNIFESLATDHHFEQAGFTVLLTDVTQL